MRPGPANRWWRARALAVLTAALISMPGIAEETGLESDFATFLKWFPGEYDNNEQVWQEKEDQAENLHERIHHIFVPMAAPAFGEHVFFVQQYLDDDPENIYRQRLYRLSIDEQEGATRLEIFSFRDEAKYRNAHLRPDSLRNISSEELIARPGCEVYWVFDQDHFRGYMHAKACSFVSERSGKEIFITDDLKLTPSEIWIRDEAFDAEGQRIFGHPERVHHKNRKVRYYTGWGGVKQAGPEAATDDEAWHFDREVTMHNEGDIWPILTASGEPSGYSLELARLTEQSTGVPVLKLGLIEDKSGYTVAYSWANPEAERIGINLRWAMVGLTLKQPGSNFGFATP